MRTGVLTNTEGPRATEEAPAQQLPDTTSRSSRPLPRLWVIRCHTRTGSRVADRPRAHQFPSTGTTGQETGPRADDLFHEPEHSPKTDTPEDPSQATVATTHTVTGTPTRDTGRISHIADSHDGTDSVKAGRLGRRAHRSQCRCWSRGRGQTGRQSRGVRWVWLLVLRRCVLVTRVTRRTRRGCGLRVRRVRQVRITGLLRMDETPLGNFVCRSSACSTTQLAVRNAGAWRVRIVVTARAFFGQR